MYSSMREIEVCVSHSSFLGPVLFLIFIQDLPLVLRNASPSIFVDDTEIMTPFLISLTFKMNSQKTLNL